MKILVTGGSGQLGGRISKYLAKGKKLWAPNRREFNLQDLDSVRNGIKNFKPELIINAGAYTQVDAAEDEPEIAAIVNARAPQVLAEEANRLKIPLIHFSTEYVFDGAKTDPYLEHDLPNPLNVYGETKLLGEQLISNAHDDIIILRTSWVYDRHGGDNFYRKMLDMFHSRKEVFVVADQIGAPTSVTFLVKQLEMLLMQLHRTRRSNFPWGLYHIAGPSFMSWYEFAVEIFETEFDHRNPFGAKVIPIESSAYEAKALRPLNSCLSSEKFRKAFDFELFANTD